MIDSFYTPPSLALRLINHLKNDKFSNVIDFCVGDGELIRAALTIWPNLKCTGTDISIKAIREVKKKHPKWKIEKCNFISKRSRSKCKSINKIKNGFDLILLNPPFSCIGGTKYEVVLDNKTFKASTAMLFLAESLKYRSTTGSILAIMPISVCYSQKDQELWNHLVTNYGLSILETPNGNYFKNCKPTIILVLINSKSGQRNIDNSRLFSLDFSNYKIFRGKISMHSVTYSSRGIPFVHSTHLRKNRLFGVKKRVLNKLSVITGPVILLPRVGAPSPEKICFLPKATRLALSDCVLAIQTKTIKNGKNIYTEILNNWKKFCELYKGTGAQFITIERLESFLSKN